MVTFSTSLASSELRSSRGTPSIRISGEESPVVLTPRNFILTFSAPGCPDVCVTVSPGRRPDSAVEKLETGARFRSVLPTEATEPVTETFFWVP